MKFMKSLSSVAAIAALTGGVTIVNVGTANAASTVTVCMDVNFVNCKNYPTMVATLRELGAANDKISSIAAVPVRMCFYDDASFQGNYMVLPAGGSVSDLRSVKYIWDGKVQDTNDKISSWRPC
ncbi:hypothetical protein OG963_43740 (plasmid) [Streptomyces sp. NBC_01707]|uniref:hypothetical protein n=1 Tax=Streptomyces sp. NBC_01707 TaxID=2975914 RepID=UPI002F91B942